MVRLFSEVTVVDKVDQGRYLATVDDSWTIGGKPNGGYLLAIVARAILEQSHFTDVLSSSVHYLFSPDPGRVEVQVDEVRVGRSFSHYEGRLFQDGRCALTVLAIVGKLSSSNGAYWKSADLDSSISPYQECKPLPITTPGGFNASIMSQVEIVMDPTVKVYTEDSPSGSGQLKGWLSLPGGEAFDSVSLQYALDSFPPATFEIERTGWVPTLSFTTYIRALPVPGPLQILQRANLVQGQMVDETCYVWDVEHNLVGQATQLAAIRLG
ncbi:MAG: thioesterase family protein [Actinomycetota bacterium]|nr:thioesterase family protein [Actinomycetota bacterium]